MRFKLNSMIALGCSCLCWLAIQIAPIVSDVCKFKYYQEKEPEALQNFSKCMKNGD